MHASKFDTHIKSKRFIVATHVYGTGASQDLVRFLKNKKAKSVLFIGHPLFYDVKLKGSGFEIYDSGRKKKEHYLSLFRIPLFVGFGLNILQTVLWGMVYGRQSDVFIGSNNINAFCGLILKKLKLVRRVVYYVIDFNPVRYENKAINGLYHWLDQFCVTHADVTWNISPRIEEGRKKYFGFTAGNQTVVPVGIWKDTLSIPRESEINPHTLVFLGHVLKKQGIQHVIDAIPSIKKAIPDFQFLILGGGEYLDRLKQQVHELTIDSSVTFAGFIPEHSVIEEKLKRCALGIALYERYDGNKLNFTYFADPTKLKSYAAAGLPVLVSDVPHNAQEIEESGSGRIITSDPTMIAQVVISLLTRPDILRTMRQNVRVYRKKFDWDSIFTNALTPHL